MKSRDVDEIGDVNEIAEVNEIRKLRAHHNGGAGRQEKV